MNGGVITTQSVTRPLDEQCVSDLLPFKLGCHQGSAMR